jgi:sensor histidine kinase YesM
VNEPDAAELRTGLRSSRVRLFWIVVWSFLFWTAVGVFFAAQLHFAGMAWSMALEWSLPRWYTWGLLTPAIFRLDRRLIGSLALGWRIALHLPLALAWTLLAIALRLVARPLRGAALPDNVAAFFLERLGPDVTIYALIAAVSLVTAYTGRLKARERQAQDRAATLERRLAEAHLHNLRAQLQPHFLFNALNTISAFTESDPPMARRLTGQLGDLLRASLAHTSRPLVPLAEELTFLDDYLAIEGARFGDRIVVNVSADDDAIEVAVPSFLLQPLVENALRHGVGPRRSGGRIDVSATRERSMLVLRVRDNGLGLRPGWEANAHGGIGLSNLRSRLAQLYGRDDLLEMTANDAGGVDVTVKVPAPSIA